MPKDSHPWSGSPPMEQVFDAIRRQDPDPWHRRLGKARGLISSALVLMLGLAVVAVIVSGGGAQADPSLSATAAEKAKTLRFSTTSLLRVPGLRPQTAQETGEINLALPAYRVRVYSGGSPIGFERLVFPRAVYVRPLRPRRPSPWVAAALSPPAVIAPTARGTNGIADPLGLLEVLRHAVSSFIGRETIQGATLYRYRADISLGAYLRAIGQAVPHALSYAPVRIGVWLDSDSRVRRVTRLFSIPGRQPATLEIDSRFNGYSKHVSIEPPAGVPLRGVEPLDPVANDPVSASVLHALETRSRHPATPALHSQGQ